MPVLPSKTFFKLSSEQEIQDRMKNLNEYLKVSFVFCIDKILNNCSILAINQSQRHEKQPDLQKVH